MINDTIDNINILLTYENPIRYRNIDSNIIINSDNDTTSSIDKTIVSLYSGMYYGFGDYLRGSILIAQYAKHFGIKFQICMTSHIISKYLDKSDQNQVTSEDTIHIYHHIYHNNVSDYRDIYKLISDFVNLDQTVLYIECNTNYHESLLSNDIKEFINSSIIFKKCYYDAVDELITLKNYNVLHIRTGDNNFTNDLPQSYKEYLCDEIKILNLTSNTVVMSSNYNLKKHIGDVFGYQYVDMKPSHTDNHFNSSNLDTEIIEYIILSRSSYTYCFTCHQHGSGFSEQCSVLNNIPYKVKLIMMI